MLKKLYLHHFRNYEKKRLDFFSSDVLLCGRNGIGKTNILEAIHYLGLMRSFKNAPVRELVQHDHDRFVIMAQFSHNGSDDKINIEQLRNGERSYFLNGMAEKKVSAMLNNFRSVIFAPEDRQIISGAAGVRRRFFDILISLENNSYLFDLQQYKHALAQRNALLKKTVQNSTKNLFAPFEELMSFHGERIMQQREAYAVLLENEVRKLSENPDFQICYRPDWHKFDQREIRLQLEKERERDMLKGFTSSGVQLDDFEFFLDSMAMRSYASSGQIRIYSLYLKMAEFHISCAGGERPIALVDDVTGELDEKNKHKFFRMLERAEQKFFTFTAPVPISADQQVIEL